MSESDVDTSAPESRAPPSVARGISVIRDALRTMPPGPGVYRMLDRRGDALYVGKARSLKSRVAHYTDDRKPRTFRRVLSHADALADGIAV